MKPVTVNSHIKVNRAKEDRRSFESPTKIPFIYVKGKLIQKDRRHIPDRRVANIEVAEYDSKLIEELFKRGIFKKE